VMFEKACSPSILALDFPDYFKNHCTAVGKLAWIETLNIGFGFILFAGQSQLIRFGHAKCIIIWEQ